MKTPLLSELTNQLSTINNLSSLEASVLLGHIISKPRTWVIAHPELTLTSEQTEQLKDAFTRLEQGESFPYVIGHWEFFGLEFDITPDVLIPRPETELLVEKAIDWLNKNPERRNIADVGTGSGAIAIALAVNTSEAKFIATDISPKALRVAEQNAARHKVNHRIEFIECDLLPNSKTVDQKSKVDLLCANLPYIPSGTLHKLPVFGHEPTLALDGGKDGFKIIQRLMDIASKHLNPNSLMLFEIEETLSNEALTLAERSFPDADIKLYKDLTGRDRLLEIQLP